MPADPLVLLVVVAGAVASGLAGFAFAAATLGLYVHFLAPGVVSPLVVAASLAVQMIVLPMIWRRPHLARRLAAPLDRCQVVEGGPWGRVSRRSPQR